MRGAKTTVNCLKRAKIGIPRDSLTISILNSAGEKRTIFFVCLFLMPERAFAE